ncbi:MAG: hypothetical protein V1764_05385 [Nitrospirota bacterium]
MNDFSFALFRYDRELVIVLDLGLDAPIKRQITFKCKFVILNPSQCVTLSPSLVILSGAKNLIPLLRTGSAKNLSPRLRVNSVKNLIKSISYKTEILRLEPQNDIATQSPSQGMKLLRFYSVHSIKALF